MTARGRKRVAVALLSGGLDSVVATASTADSDSDGVALALTFDYGQKAARREIAAARAVARQLGIEWQSIKLPWLAKLLPSSLARGGKAPPKVRAGKLDVFAEAARRARAVWVPNRNGVFLNIAAAHAEAIGAGAVVAGFNKEEAATFPDNSPEFMKRATGALALSTQNKVRIVSPTSKLDKTGIVRLGMRLSAPLDRVWSCYTSKPKMCGVCESCARLLRALRDAGAQERVWPRALRAHFGSP